MRTSTWLAVALVATLCACTPASPPKKPILKIANPASVHCVKLGGTLESRTGDKGEYALCRLPGGAVCEEWSLFRGACP